MYRNEIIKLYSEYSSQFDEKIGSLKNYDESYTDFVTKAERKENLLDLACGPGNVSIFIKKLKPKIEITGVDLSEEMLQIAEDKIGEGNFYKSNILSICIPEKKYDLITCAFGIPYIKNSEIEGFIRELTRFSKKGTTVYISCMAGEKLSEEPMSFAKNKTLIVQRYKKNDIIDNFKKFYFALKSYKTIEYKEPDGSSTTDMIFNFRKE